MSRPVVEEAGSWEEAAEAPQVRWLKLAGIPQVRCPMKMHMMTEVHGRPLVGCPMVVHPGANGARLPLVK